MVFLLAGPATNAVTITVVAKELGKGATAIYVLTIAVMSVLSGMLLNRLWFGAGQSIPMMHHVQGMLPRWVEVASAVILAALIVNVVIRDMISKFRKG